MPITLYKPVVGGKVGRTASVQFGSKIKKKNVCIWVIRDILNAALKKV